jgi:hypothetical protein
MNNTIIYVSLLFGLLLMTSCNGPIGYAIHVAKTDTHTRSYNTNEEADDDTVRFVIHKNSRQMLMKAEINDVEDTVLFDSGSSIAAVLFYTDENKPKGMRFYKVPLMGADKTTKVQTTYIPVTIKHNMYVCELFGNAMLLEPSHFCDKEATINRYNILGFKGISTGCYSIDFTKNQIYAMNHFQIDSTQYLPVKCKFESDLLFVYPTINGVEYECVFDTGNGQGILIQDAQRVENHTEKDLLYEGSYGKAVGGVTESQRFIIAPDTKVGFAEHEETLPVMFMEKSLAFNNVGLQYLKRFDWIIDDYYNKVYARPHVADTMELREVVHYGLVTADGTLKIATRLIDGNEVFNISDRIISVNGETINEDNICYYYDLLTTQNDWSEFEIIVEN